MLNVNGMTIIVSSAGIPMPGSRQSISLTSPS